MKLSLGMDTTDKLPTIITLLVVGPVVLFTGILIAIGLGFFLVIRYLYLGVEYCIKYLSNSIINPQCKR